MQPAYIIEGPTLCMVVGVPSSGKSSLAERLAKGLVNGSYISKDLIQSAFTKTERVTGETYSMVQGPAFEILVSYADVQLSLGKTPIIDAPFSINHWRNDEYSDWVSPFRRVAEKHKAKLKIVRCLPPSEEELRRRIEESKHLWDKWKIDNWNDFLEREPVNFPIDHDHYEIKSYKPVEKMAAEVLVDYLEAKPHGL